MNKDTQPKTNVDMNKVPNLFHNTPKNPNVVSRQSRLNRKPETKESVSMKMRFYKFLAISFATTTFMFVGLVFTSKFFDTYKLSFQTPIVIQTPIVMTPRVMVSAETSVKKPKVKITPTPTTTELNMVAPIPESDIITDEKKKN